MKKTRFHSHMWSITFRNAKGETMGMSCADPSGLLDEALRFNAVAITLHRERKTGGYVETHKMRGILKTK